MKVKLCGFTEIKSLETAIKTRPDFIGFIFHENSPRNISPIEAGKIAKIIPQNIAKVAVTVDANQEKLQEIVNELNPDYLQFHGDESVEYIKEVRRIFPSIKIIKAFKLLTVGAQNFEPLQNFENICDYFMFDNSVPGSGKSWDYSILKNLKSKKDWFLSGGLNIDNVREAVIISGAKMIDISSGIEKERGVKSSELIIEFMNKVKNVT